nr:helix-turn-helix transcriptional regulator [Streptomyces uncialis]
MLARRTQLGDHLAAARRARRMSQDDLADAVGMERRSIQRYERGERDPRFSDLVLIARALDVPLRDLV